MAKIILEIDDQLFDKLNKSLMIQNESLEQAFLQFTESYIKSAYEKLYKLLGDLKTPEDSKTVTPTDSYKRPLSFNVHNDLKGVRRISTWARKPDQYNHRIIRAFFQLERENKVVRTRDLQLRCTDKAKHPEVFVPTFSSNFSQMKFDEGNSHGKIFEEEYGIVTIWEKAKEELESHRHFFE